VARPEPAEFIRPTPIGPSEDATVEALVDRARKAILGGSSSPLILAGGIGAGKTQTALRAVQRLREAGVRVGGVLAPRLTERGRTVGYAVLDLHSGEDRPFARSTPPGHPVGRFYVSDDALGFAAEALHDAIRRDQIVVLDEIGRWELQGGGHAPALRELLSADVLPILLVRAESVVDVIDAFGIDDAEIFRLGDVESPGADTFWSLVDAVEFPLLVTRGEDGYPQSRPMHLLEREEGTLWFSTSKASRKVRQIAEDPQVTVLFVDTHRFNYASLHGVAEIVDDSERGHRLWREEWRDDWPDGPEDPDYVLLRVIGERGFYLRGSSGESGEVALPQDRAS
jgi:general stress protein 26/nucleoside-triphosphatase THEP1